MNNRLREWASLLPGMLLLFAVGYSGKLLEKFTGDASKSFDLMLPKIEYVLWAIVIGMFISNVFKVHKVFKPGIETYEFFLKIGIVFLGSRFLLVDVLKLGGLSLVMVAMELAISILMMNWIGKKFGLSQKLTSLLAVGSSVCGASAIIATSGAINANKKETSIAITAILTVGAFSLFLLPVVGHWLNLTDYQFGMWAGLSVDNTAEAVATGALYSDEAGKVAVLVKTARNATIGFIVLGYAIYYARLGLANKVENKGIFLWQNFPKFVLGFLVVSILASSGALSKDELSSLASLSKWAFLMTFAGIGLNMNLSDMFEQGIRPFVIGVIGEILIAAVTLAMVLVLLR